MGARQRFAETARTVPDVDVHRFPEGTRTAADATRAVGITVAQIVKSLVFVVGDEAVVALMSGPGVPRSARPHRCGAVPA